MAEPKKFAFNHVLLDTTDPEVIQRWRYSFEILSDQHKKNYFLFRRIRENCDCKGDYEFTFMRHQSLPLTFTLHHLSHIRSESIYNGYDANLSEKSIKSIGDLLHDLQSQH